MDTRAMLGPALVGVGGYLSGVQNIKTAMQNAGAKIDPNNPTTGVKILGALFVVGGALIRAYSDSAVADGLAYTLAGFGAGLLGDPVPTPVQKPAPAPVSKPVQINNPTPRVSVREYI